MGKTVAKKPDKKATKKSGKADAKKAEPEPVIVTPPPPPELEPAAGGTKDSGSTTAVEDPTKPPTPPPESEAPSPKKERAKVVRQNGASSWGFWGAAPKQTPATKKAKDDASATPASKPKAAAPALTRSKSARKATDRDPEKSSVSDKAKSATSRPKSSRGQSGFSIFGATPSRSRSMRQSATPKTASRAASESRDAAMLTPPPDEELPKVSEKAAKVMGMSSKERASMSRKASTRSGKTKGIVRPQRLGRNDINEVVIAAPDPYSVDGDDIVMVDPVVVANVASPAAEKAARRKSQRTSRAPADDTLIDVDGLGATTGAEDAAFETPRRPLVRRSNTTSTKKGGGFMGGLFGKSTGRDDRRSRGYETEDGAARSKRSRSDRERPTTGRV
ncbi:hypothetical protein LTS18_014113, partial [Coniosporium uncinatum]